MRQRRCRTRTTVPARLMGCVLASRTARTGKFPPSLSHFFVELARDLPGTTLPPKARGFNQVGAARRPTPQLVTDSAQGRGELPRQGRLAHVHGRCYIGRSTGGEGRRLRFVGQTGAPHRVLRPSTGRATASSSRRRTRLYRTRRSARRRLLVVAELSFARERACSASWAGGPWTGTCGQRAGCLFDDGSTSTRRASRFRAGAATRARRLLCAELGGYRPSRKSPGRSRVLCSHAVVTATQPRSIPYGRSPAGQGLVRPRRPPAPTPTPSSANRFWANV